MSLAASALDFARTLDRLDGTAGALNALDVVAKFGNLNLLGAWRVPGHPADWHEYVANQTIFKHSSVPEKFWSEYFELARKHGPSIMAQRARLNTGPFTFLECSRDANPIGAQRWVFEVLAKHGMRDGFYVPMGAWMVVFWSSRRVQLSAADRASLAFAAQHLVLFLQLSKLGNHRKDFRPHLTERELQIMQELSIGHRRPEIARNLGIRESTVRTFIRRAQKKLKAKTTEHAVAQAVRTLILRTAPFWTLIQ